MQRPSLTLLVALLLCWWSKEDQRGPTPTPTPTTLITPGHSRATFSPFAAATSLPDSAESSAQSQRAESERGGGAKNKQQKKKKKRKKKASGIDKGGESESFQQQTRSSSKGSGSGFGSDPGARSQQLERAASQFKQLWVRAVALNDVRTLLLLLERRQAVPFDTVDCGDSTRTCLHTALAGYHSALQSGNGFSGDAEAEAARESSTGQAADGGVQRPGRAAAASSSSSSSSNPLLQTLTLLTNHAGLNAALFCPVVDAIHFRLVDGIHFLVDRMSADEIAE